MLKKKWHDFLTQVNTNFIEGLIHLIRAPKKVLQVTALLTGLVEDEKNYCRLNKLIERTMALKHKYQELLTAARAAGVYDLQVKEQNSMLYIEGIAPSEKIKEKLFILFERINSGQPGDVVLNISTTHGNGETKDT